MFEGYDNITRLASRVALYVPSTTDTDKPTDPAEMIKTVAGELSAMFGGATAQEARGYWQSESAGLVAEAVTVIYSNATPEAIEARAGELLELAERIKREMAQEAVSMEIDGALYLI